MGRMMGALVAVVMSATCALGQLSEEETARRLEEMRQRAAATKPVAEAERARLVKENAQLRQQIKDLQQSIATLESRIERMAEKTRATEEPKAPAKVATDPMKRLRLHIPMAEAKEILGGEGTLTDSGTSGSARTETYEWRLDDGHSIIVDFSNGTVEGFSRR